MVREMSPIYKYISDHVSSNVRFSSTYLTNFSNFKTTHHNEKCEKYTGHQNMEIKKNITLALLSFNKKYTPDQCSSMSVQHCKKICNRNPVTSIQKAISTNLWTIHMPCPVNINVDLIICKCISWTKWTKENRRFRRSEIQVM